MSYNHLVIPFSLVSMWLTNTCTYITLQVMNELQAKDKELAQLQLKLEVKDQEGHKHKLNVEKLQR